MEPDSNNKIKTRIFILLVLVFVSLALITGLAFQGLGNSNAYSFSILVERGDLLKTAHISFERARRHSLELSNANDPASVTDAMFANLDIAEGSLREYSHLSLDWSFDEVQRVVDNLYTLIDEYRSRLIQISELARESDKLNTALSENEPLAAEIEGMFLQLSDYTMALSDETLFRHESAGHNTAIMLIMISVTAFIVISIVSISLPSAARVSQTGERHYDNNRRTANISFQDLERCISDLKAVTYDLSKASDNLKNKP